MKRYVLLALAVMTATSVAMAESKPKKATKPKTTSESTEAKPAEEGASEDNGHQKHMKKHKESLHDQFSGGGYGLAGCGLGSIVFGPKPGMIQIVAATVNATAASQTFGITTGTSNCDIPEMGHQAAAFIEVNKEIVKKEASRGEGETVSGLAHIFSCKDSALFGRKIQQNFETIFSDKNNSYESSRQILHTIESDSELRTTCDQLG